MKTGKRLSDVFYATAQTEESSTKPSVHMFTEKHATTETVADDEHKLQIKLVKDMNVNKESEEDPSLSHTHIKMAEGMHATKETESHEEVVPRRKPSTEMSATKESENERETDIPRMKKSKEMHGTKETESTVWVIKAANVFGHVSKMSTSDDEVVINAPRLKRYKHFHSSMESRFSRDFGIKPRIKMSKTMTSTKESEPEEGWRPGIRMGTVSASTESEAIDHDENRLQKFKSVNVYGHSSDSSVQTLLYGNRNAGDQTAQGNTIY